MPCSALLFDVCALVYRTERRALWRSYVSRFTFYVLRFTFHVLRLTARQAILPRKIAMSDTLVYKPDWPAAQRRLIAFWERTNNDRPCIMAGNALRLLGM